eukprot:scaffold57668_cov63-Phaeocystis_antarctica.AAC.2
MRLLFCSRLLSLIPAGVAVNKHPRPKTQNPNEKVVASALASNACTSAPGPASRRGRLLWSSSSEGGVTSGLSCARVAATIRASASSLPLGGSSAVAVTPCSWAAPRVSST